MIWVNFDLRRIKDQSNLLWSTRKVNKIVTVISRIILTARAIDVTNFPITICNDMSNTTTKDKPKALKRDSIYNIDMLF